MIGTTACALPISMLLIRGFIADNSGWESAGHLQVSYFLIDEKGAVGACYGYLFSYLFSFIFLLVILRNIFFANRAE